MVRYNVNGVKVRFKIRYLRRYIVEIGRVYDLTSVKGMGDVDYGCVKLLQ